MILDRFSVRVGIRDRVKFRIFVRNNIVDGVNIATSFE